MQSYPFTIRDLPPQEMRRVEVKADFGNINCQTPEGGGPQLRCRANIYCDDVQFEGSRQVKWARRPENAAVSIGDCPKFSIVSAGLCRPAPSH